jgi:hypothetical protein
MTPGYLLVALGYAALAFAVYRVEARRTRGAGVDVTTIFMALCLLQCCIPGIAIYATLPFVDVTAPTGFEVFDRIYQAVDMTTALLVLMLTAWFVIFFYVGGALGRLALGRRSPADSTVPSLFSLSVHEGRLLAVLAVGLVFTLLMFYEMGDSITTRYAHLILFRAGVTDIERNALNANAFSLTQTWAWLSVVAIFASYELRGRGWVWGLCLAFAVIFAVLGVSRRSLFLPLLFSYLTFTLYRGRWRLRWVMVAAVPLLLVLAFGKEILATLAFGGNVESIAGNYQSWTNAMLRAFSDMGLTIVESLGTLLFLPHELRFGVDHMLSLAQRFPEGVLGWDFNFPERIVRISTTAFENANAQDIPPGLAGQMWLDFGPLGPVVWGVIFGLQMSVLQFVFERTEKTLRAAALFVLLTFVVVLPINTGSFDFSFNVDIIALVLVLLWCVRFRRQREPSPAVLLTTEASAPFGPLPIPE